MNTESIPKVKVNYYSPPYQMRDDKRLYDMYDCITRDGEISEQCAKNIGCNQFLVNDDVMLKTRGKLTETSYLPFSKGRKINTGFILNSYQSFYYDKRLRTIRSECVIPYYMLHKHLKKYDGFPTSGRTINGVLITKNQQYCITDLRDLFTTYKDDYNKV
jgi:hypothetical protein